ncbi:hypothetical protein Tco_1046359, partial [Tanacetum coccineum]
MPENSRIPIILGRPFLATTHAMTDMFNKMITLRVGDDEVIFDMDQSMKNPSSENDECYGIDDLDDTISKETQELLEGYHLDSFLDSDFESAIWRIDSSNTAYRVEQKTEQTLIVSSKLSVKEKKSLLQVLEKHKGAISWKMSDIKRIRFFQIPIAPKDQDKIMFTCLYGTFAYRRMPFRLCNAPATFQRCMTTIFHDMVEDFMEVFMDDFSIFGNSFDCCLTNLDKILAR